MPHCGGEHVVICAIGPDRPGIADEVSEYVYERGGNMEESRMANLHGQFTLMVLVGGSAETVGRIEREKDALATGSGLSVMCRPATGVPARTRNALPYQLTTYSMDREGIFQPVAHLLREENVNIESAETHVTPAPHTGAPVFSMEAVISVPPDCQTTRLRRALATLCDELNVDFSLRPAQGV